ncbi:MAG: diaminopimelate decarboxylase, partial [Gammaproteobacteria bacterium]|nr:diaminopimelate decarboxylase [Gammaproteobacteria bacterium]
MTNKQLPLDETLIREIIQDHPTPFHLYDEKAIRENTRRLIAAFDGCPGFKEYFAVKANPNPHLLKILKQEGFGADCSSLPELILAEKVGIVGEEIMFSSNNTPVKEFAKAKELGALINLDDLTHIDFLDQHLGLPDVICFRYNPGTIREGNVI